MARRRDDSLKRRRPYIQPKRRFTIFTEDEITEPAYFTALRTRLRDALVDIRPFGKGVSPSRVAEAAVRYAQANPPRGSFEEHDQVWAVFDRDTHQDVDDAIKLCRANGIGVGHSNPCFEVWLILHVVEHYDGLSTSKTVQKDLKKHRPEYDHARGKCPNCAELLVDVVKAETRAEMQLKRRQREGKPFGNPSTTVFELTREIHAAAKASARKR